MAISELMRQSGSVIYQARFVDVDGIRTRYYDEGQGEAMALIHGSRFSRFKRDKEETDQWIRAGRLTMPVLVTWGASDPSAILPVGISLFEIICDKTRRAQMHIFNNVAHFHYREIPEEWNRVVLNFIDMSH